MQQQYLGSRSPQSILRKLGKNFKRYGIRHFPSWILHQLEWRWLKYIRNVRFTERKIQHFRLVLDLDDVGLSKELFLSDLREEEHIFILNEFLKPGMCVLDCGANIGYYSVLMGNLVGPDGKIYAVEPSEDNFRLLGINVNLNKMQDRVSMFNMALGDSVGTGTMFHSKMSNRHTFHPFEYVGPSEQTLADRPPTDVAMTTVPAFAKQQQQPINLVRMDVEGFEVEILSGMTSELIDGIFAPAILFETHRPRYDREKHDIQKPLQELFSFGYRVRWLAVDGFKEMNSRSHYRSLGYDDRSVAAYFSSSDRAVYEHMTNEHALDLISTSDTVRAVFLETGHHA